MTNFNRNNFKLTFDKQSTQFFVNKKKRTVSCLMVAELVVPYAWCGPVHIPNEFFKVVGTARCTDGDTFDVERGKRIALAKAENKAYLRAASYLNEQQEDIIFMDNAITEFRKKAHAQCAHNEDYMDSISNPEHPRYKKRMKRVKTGNTIVSTIKNIFKS